MKRNTLKATSFLISVIIIITSLAAVCCIPVGAESTATTQNLLKDLIPITYTGATQGTTSYNWQPVRIDENNNTMWGYDTIIEPNEGASGIESWKVYLTKLTDDDAETAQWVQPGRTYNPYDDFVIAYELETGFNLDSFSLNTTNTDSKTVAVYASNTKTNLFKNKVAEVTTTDANVTATLSTINTKYVGFLLTTPGYYVSEISVFGNESAALNVISGKLPSAFAATNSGNISYTWAMIRTENTDVNKIWGYDTLQYDHIDVYDDTKKAYLTPLTDGGNDKSLWIQPEWCYTGSRYDDMYIIYELDGKTNLKGFTFNTTTSSSKTIDVYAAGTYAELFENKITTVTTDNLDIVATFETECSKYIAFVIKTPAFFLSEIAVYGEEVAPNVLKGETPIVYSAANSGGTTYNWTDTVIDASGTRKHGYSIPMKQSVSGFGSWIPYLTKLTDGTPDMQWVQPANSGNDFVIVYELKGNVDINGFSVNTARGDVQKPSKTLKVYAAVTYEDLFNNNVKTVTTTNTCIEESITTTDSRYIAFVFTTPAYYVTEISVYGDSDYDASSEVTFTKSNVIKDEMPVVYTSADSGATNYNWRQVYINSDHNQGKKGGYSMPMSEAVGGFESWKTYLTKFTDEDAATAHWVEPEDSDRDLVIVYQFKNNVELEGFRLDAYGNNINGKVYASASYSELFTDANRIATLQSSDYLNCFTGAASGTAKYVAFVFTRPAFSITEISVYGDTVSDNVAFTKSNLLEGEIPITYTAANSGGTSYNWHLVRTKNSAEGTMSGYDSLITPTQGLELKENWISYLTKFTDADAATVQWVQPEQIGLNDDMVIVYELEAPVNIEGFSFDTYGTASKTVKVYAANNSADLFDSNNNVATITTENYIVKGNIQTVATKYVAFVLTAPAYYVSEIKVYGEDTYSIGDTNCDGAVNIYDLAYLRKVLLEIEDVIVEKTTDINSDTYIDIRDLVSLKNKLTVDS